MLNLSQHTTIPKRPGGCINVPLSCHCSLSPPACRCNVFNSNNPIYTTTWSTLIGVLNHLWSWRLPPVVQSCCWKCVLFFSVHHAMCSQNECGSIWNNPASGELQLFKNVFDRIDCSWFPSGLSSTLPWTDRVHSMLSRQTCSFTDRKGLLSTAWVVVVLSS